MKIEKNRVVRFHYTVSEVGQPPTETSRDREPLAVLIGAGNIIPGLEAAMMDKAAGDSFEATVTPDQAYGERREGFVQRVPKKHFGNQRLVPGQQVVLQTNFGPRAVTIEKVGMSVVDASGTRTYSTPCGTAAAMPKALFLPSFTTRVATASLCMPASSKASLS